MLHSNQKKECGYGTENHGSNATDAGHVVRRTTPGIAVSSPGDVRWMRATAKKRADGVG